MEERTESGEKKSDLVVSEINKTNKNKWIETVTAILLSAATILSAWCVYEASQWNGEQYFRIEDENNADRKRMQKQIVAYQRMSLDGQLFLELINAVTSKNDEMSNFLSERLPPHLKKAAIAWKALDPMNNPNAPLSPMHMKEYIIPEAEDIEMYTVQAKAFKMAANECDNNADNYMLLSLVLSSVMFFCGLSGIMDARLNKLILIGFATVIFIITLYFVIIFPVML